MNDKRGYASQMRTRDGWRPRFDSLDDSDAFARAEAATGTTTVYGAAYIHAARLGRHHHRSCAQHEFVDSYLAAVAVSRQYAERKDGALVLEAEGPGRSTIFGDQTHVGVQRRAHRASMATGSHGATRLNPSAAFGLRLSYATELPPVEVELEGESHQTLVYWVLEMTAGSSWTPGGQFRCVFTIARWPMDSMGDEGGMNAVGLGVALSIVVNASRMNDSIRASDRHPQMATTSEMNMALRHVRIGGDDAQDGLFRSGPFSRAIEAVRPRGRCAGGWFAPLPPLIRRNAEESASSVDNPNLDLYTLDDFLSAKECARLVALIGHHLHPSTLAYSLDDDAVSHQPDGGSLSPAQPDGAVSIDAKICRTLGIRAEYSEGIQAQRYDVGQQFKPHWDYFEPDTDAYRRLAGVRGNRTWTFMVYLNDGLEGGATRFTKIDHAVEPKAGMALLWNNLNAGRLTERVHHALRRAGDHAVTRSSSPSGSAFTATDRCSHGK